MNFTLDRDTIPSQTELWPEKPISAIKSLLNYLALGLQQQYCILYPLAPHRQ